MSIINLNAVETKALLEAQPTATITLEKRQEDIYRVIIKIQGLNFNHDTSDTVLKAFIDALPNVVILYDVSAL